MEMNILLGAGFSKAIFDDFPLMTELTQMALSDPEIAGLIRNLDLPFAVFSQGPAANFENWISVLEESDIYIQDSVTRERRRYLVKLLENFAFEKIRSVSNAMSITEEKIRQIQKLLLSKSNILTTNYDLVLEYVVQDLITRNEMTLDSPYGLNSGLFDFAFQRRNLAYLDGGNAGNGDYSKIFKLHGSCDWYSFADEVSDKFWVDVSRLKNFMYPDRKSASADSVALMSPIRALPGASKGKALSNLAMRRIWQEAHQAIKGKSGLAVFGSAINPRDSALVSLLIEGLPKETPIFIFDKEPEKVAENLRQISPASNITKIATDNLSQICDLLATD